MAVEKRFSVALDVKRSVGNRDIEVVEGDNGNIIDVTLTDGGQPVELTGCRVLAVFSKSNGTSSQDSAKEDGGITIDGNLVSIALFISSFAPGMVECELQIYSDATLSTLITTAKFNFKCRRGIFNEDTAQATNEYPMLVALIKLCGELEAGLAYIGANEGARQTAEIGRQSAESLRSNAEATRVTAENARIAAANASAAAEAARVIAENARVAAEAAKVEAENGRGTAEAARVASENARITAENARVAAESARAAAEIARVAAEAARVALMAARMFIGAYSADAAYVPGNEVTYNGSTYRNTTACTGVLPTVTDNWILVARAGDGDMSKVNYDPRGRNTDAFLLANMDEDETHRIVTDEEKAAWDDHIQETGNPHGATGADILLTGYVDPEYPGEYPGVISAADSINAAIAKLLYYLWDNGAIFSKLYIGGIIKGDGYGEFDLAVAGTDYATPGLLVTGLSLPTSGYSGEGPYTINITVTGASTASNKRYLLIPEWSSEAMTRMFEKNNWNLIDYYEISAANTLTLTLIEPPGMAVSFSVKEVV